MSEIRLTITIVGDAAVGKTCLVIRFTTDSFNRRTTGTVGFDLVSMEMKMDTDNVKLIIRDTAGIERMPNQRGSLFFRGVHGVIFAYDINRASTFKHVPNWMEEMKQNCTNDNVVTALVGLQSDVGDRQVSVLEASEFAVKHGMLFAETSSKTPEGVNDLFKTVVQKIIQKQSLNGTYDSLRDCNQLQLTADQKNDQAGNQKGDGNINTNVAVNGSKVCSC